MSLGYRFGGAGGGGSFNPQLLINSETDCTVTISKGLVTVSASEISTGVYECAVPDFGTWTVLSVDENEEEATATVNVSIIQQYTVDVYHTFDYNKWLELGGVTGTYASLAAVFEDEEATRRLMTVHASADYLIDMQSKFSDTIDPFVANDTAMKWIGLRDYTCDGLTAINGVETKFLNSTYWEKYLKDHVPVMTSNTAPYGEASSNSTYSGLYAFWAFNGNEADGWHSAANATNTYLRYKFTNPLNAKKATIVYNTNSAEGTSLSGVLQASNDASTWTNIEEVTLQGTNLSIGRISLDLENNDHYLYYQLFFANGTYPNNKYWAVTELQFYGRSLNVSVPVMTSNTAPYGEIIYGSNFSTSGNVPYKAFDSSVGTKAVANASGSAAFMTYIGYDFATSVCLKAFIYQGNTDTPLLPPTSIQLKGYDGSNWVAIGNSVSVNADAATHMISVQNTSSYSKYRIDCVSRYYSANNATYVQFAELQFYGVDYSEREFATGTTKKWLYDHGLKLDSNITTLRGTVAENSDYVIVRDTGNTAASYGFNSIDLSPYTLSRAKTLGFTSNGGKSIIVGSINLADTYTLFSSTNSPNNVALDISTINTTKALFLQADSGGGNIVELLVAEWWLE